MSIQLSTVPIDDFRKGKIDKMNAAMDLCSDTDEQMDENTEEQQKTIFRQQLPAYEADLSAVVHAHILKNR